MAEWSAAGEKAWSAPREIGDAVQIANLLKNILLLVFALPFASATRAEANVDYVSASHKKVAKENKRKGSVALNSPTGDSPTYLS